MMTTKVDHCSSADAFHERIVLIPRWLVSLSIPPVLRRPVGNDDHGVPFCWVCASNVGATDPPQQHLDWYVPIEFVEHQDFLTIVV